MLVTLVSTVLFLIFMALGGIHLYWFGGGTKWAEKVIPSKDGIGDAKSIPKFATLLVALILLSFGLLYLLRITRLDFNLPIFIVKYAYWFIPAIFILRAVGEFKYVGFFKKIKHTEFAQADSRIFSPLCFIIGILGIYVQLNS